MGFLVNRLDPRRRIHELHFAASQRASSRMAFKFSSIMKFGNDPLSRSASTTSRRRRLNSLTATNTASARLRAPVFFTTALSSLEGISTVVFMEPTITDTRADFNAVPPGFPQRAIPGRIQEPANLGARTALSARI